MAVGITAFEDALIDWGSFGNAFVAIAHAADIDVVAFGFEEPGNIVSEASRRAVLVDVGGDAPIEIPFSALTDFFFHSLVEFFFIVVHIHSVLVLMQSYSTATTKSTANSAHRRKDALFHRNFTKTEKHKPIVQKSCKFCSCL